MCGLQRARKFRKNETGQLIWPGCAIRQCLAGRTGEFQHQKYDGSEEEGADYRLCNLLSGRMCPRGRSQTPCGEYL